MANPLPDIISKPWPIIVAVRVYCQKLLITQIVLQIAILETTDNTSAREIKVRK